MLSNLHFFDGPLFALFFLITTLVHALGTYTYQGCYTDSAARTLVGPSYSDGANMTSQSCISFCNNAGFFYAGTEYSSQCYCGNIIANTTTIAPASDCNFPCSGNSTQVCGGSNRLSLFWNGLNVTTNPGVAPWSLVGCYTEGITGRTLETSVTGGSTLTVGVCTAACQAAGFVLAGVEYGSQCWCGNVFSSGGLLAPDGFAQCNTQCSGNLTEYCGGPDHLDVYSFDNAISTILPTKTSTAVPSATATLGITPTVSSYTYLGCWTEGDGVRALSEASDADDGMTLEACAGFCQGYRYWGTEYGRECYCGDSFGAGSVATNDTDCSFLCAGDVDEFCGAGNRLSVYQIKD